MRNISNTFLVVRNHQRLVSIFEDDNGKKFSMAEDGEHPVDRASAFMLKKEREDLLNRMEVRKNECTH